MCLYERYVDDIIVIGDKREEVNCSLREINTHHKYISLTKETNNQLPFLDTLTSRRDDDFIKPSVYIKSIWTGKHLSSHSHCSVQYKRGIMNDLFNTTNLICPSDATEEDAKLVA